MKRIGCITLASVLVLSAATVASAAPMNDNVSTQVDIKQMIRDAHSTPQYREIAVYYRAKQQSFEQKAQAEKVEWDRRSQNVSGPAAKYPRPVDSSKNRYEYFSYEAQQAGLQAQHYEGLSAQNQ